MRFKKLLTLSFICGMILFPMTASANDIDTIQTEISSLEDSLTDVTNEITIIEDEIEEKNIETNKLEKEIEELEKNPMISSYIPKIDSILLNYKSLVSSEKIFDLNVSELDRICMIKILDEINEIQLDVDNLEKEKEDLISSKTELENKLNDIQAQINENEELIEKYKAEEKAEEEAVARRNQTRNPSWNGSVLSASAGVNYGPTGKETYYNLDMSGVVSIMRSMGNNDEYWVRADGCKMLGNYIMVAANLNMFPRGSLVETSLGTGIVCDTGSFASENPTQLDIATTW